jgi:hypothetical protein
MTFRSRVIAGWQSEETNNGYTEVWFYALTEDGILWGRPRWADRNAPWEKMSPTTPS